MQMPGRRYYQNAAKQYRFGFNGKEEDDEVKGDGNQQDYGFRIYDPRLGRFLSVDPLTMDYPELTPYQFSDNNPVHFIDLDGTESAYRMPDGSIIIMPKGDNLKVPAPIGGKLIGPDVRGFGGSIEDWSTFLDMIPGIGTAKGLIEGITGKDIITGKKISLEDRVTGLLPYVKTAKKAYKVIKAADKLDDVKTVNKAANKIDEAKKAIVKDPAGTPNRVESVSVRNTKAKKVEVVADKKKTELPSIDATGKVHGALPKIEDFSKYSKDELFTLLQELKKSVQKRIEVTSKLGRDKGHGQRQGAEQDLIKSLEKYLDPKK